MKNISFIKEKCTGCTACVNICPKGAINMVADDGGFHYPFVDNSLCVDCGLCVSSCPAATIRGNKDTRVRAFYGSALDLELVGRSSSGGAFSLMAESVLREGGLVIGAALDYDSLDLVYKSTDECELDSLRRSKYIASIPGDIFGRVKKELENGRRVLFCGLPCHVHGLRRFLHKEYPNLITCDFICGGTASPRFFKEHISHLEKKYRAKATDVNFRAKLNGWKEHSIKIKFANSREYRSIAHFDSFFKGYFEKPYQRNSCYNCQYRLSHESDIIIADYWGGLKKGRGNDTGVSMVITNSEKGDTFFSEIMELGGHSFVEMPLEDSNYVFKTEEERYTNAYKTKSDFMTLYKKHGFEKAARRSYFKGVRISKLKRKILKLIKRGRK